MFFNFSDGSECAADLEVFAYHSHTSICPFTVVTVRLNAIGYLKCFTWTLMLNMKKRVRATHGTSTFLSSALIFSRDADFI